MSRSPFDALLDRVDWRCAICKAKAGMCDCWQDCPCGWAFQKGHHCNNPKCIVQRPSRPKAANARKKTR